MGQMLQQKDNPKQIKKHNPDKKTNQKIKQINNPAADFK